VQRCAIASVDVCALNSGAEGVNSGRKGGIQGQRATKTPGHVRDYNSSMHAHTLRLSLYVLRKHGRRGARTPAAQRGVFRHRPSVLGDNEYKPVWPSGLWATS
jgi:hypothetical protein